MTTLHELGKVLEALGRELQAGGAPAPANDLGYVDPADVGVGSAARRAIRAGQLRGFRVGRKILVRREDLQRWIEAHPAGPPPADPPVVDDVDQVIAANNGRRRRRRL